MQASYIDSFLSVCEVLEVRERLHFAARDARFAQRVAFARVFPGAQPSFLSPRSLLNKPLHALQAGLRGGLARKNLRRLGLGNQVISPQPEVNALHHLADGELVETVRYDVAVWPKWREAKRLDHVL